MIELVDLKKSYAVPSGRVEALRGVNLKIADGEIYGIIGMSGAGKSTLVRCINLLERPTSGKVIVDGRDLCALAPHQLNEVRRGMSMIFQSFNLLKQRSCLANVRFPLELSGVSKRSADARARELLGLVGLADKANAYPSQLSGGQQQRVAIARALATGPKVLLCDEATSALDPTTTASILRLIRELHDSLGLSVVIITHQMSVVESVCTRVAILDEGLVAEEGTVEAVFAKPSSVAGRRLVYPEGYAELADRPERCIRVVFKGTESASSPLIARLAREQGILANILAASTKNVGGRVFGTMLLGLPDDGQSCARALDFLHSEGDIIAEEVSPLAG